MPFLRFAAAVLLLPARTRAQSVRTRRKNNVLRWAFATLTMLGLLSSCGGGDADGDGTAGTGGVRGEGGSGGARAPGAPLDRSDISYVDNLLVKVEDGEWTLEEGLVATLEVIAGERDQASILRHPELYDAEGTGILTMAAEYLEDGPDDGAKSEITRLLDGVVLSTERLEAMVGVGPPDPAPTSMKSVDFAPKNGIQNCLDFFEGYKTPPGVGNCLQYQSTLLLDEQYPDDYRVFGPAPPWPDGGWAERHFDLALEALEEAVPIYKAMGQLPPVSIVLSVTRNGTTYAAAASKYDPPCGVVLYVKMQSQTDGDFKQIIAHELGHCFQQATFTEQNEVKYKFVMWREEGLANYLSNLVYPDNNREWGKPPARRSGLDLLAKWELASTVLERSYTNSIFFQYLGQRLGDNGLFALVRSLPTIYDTGLKEQADALAAYSNMETIYHEFAKALTDKDVIDTSGQVIPYELSEVNRPPAKLDSPLLIMQDFDRFSVSRYLLTIEDEKRAKLTYSPEGKVREASRPESGGDWMSIPAELPAPECVQELIVVVTTIETDSGYELEAPEPEETEAACGIVGTWVVQNSSIRFDPGSFTLDSVAGRISITFDADGSAKLVYSGFTYTFSKVTVLDDVGGLLVVRTEQNTYTTNASGTTTYEVDGDGIAFGHLFEGDYLVGFEEVHQVRKHSPSVVGEDIDEVRQRDPDGLDLFGTFVKFEVQSGGTVMHILGVNDKVDAVLHRTGSGIQ